MTTNPLFKIISLITTYLVFSNTYSQTLNLTPRNVTALNGDQVVSAITNLSLYDRELYILDEVLNGNVPGFYRNMSLVKDSSFISGAYKVIEYYVIPDYLALGHDTNYYLCPMTPILGQMIADSLNCMLPTKKMVDQIWNNANLHMTPQTIAPSAQMTTVPVMNDHNEMVWSQREPQLGTHPLGTLTGGDKKDVVISNQIYTLPSPARVLIYGWHQTNGSPIQPLYGGHIDTYADYSHGIRLVQKVMYLDGNPVQAEDILNSSTLNVLLSHEGVIAQPYYPDTSSTTTGTAPTSVKSFAVLPNNNTSLNIKISNHSADSYHVYSSTDGISFAGPSTFTNTNFVLSGLSSGTSYFVKILAENNNGTSAFSEVLGAFTGINSDSILIVNGFDRGSTGNTYDFVNEHAQSIMQCGNGFASATNDAIFNGLISLNNYKIVDYILGEESTVDETFSTTEQNTVRQFLQNGGNLIVSGAEVGWDLDQQGSAGDQSFYNNILKADYVDDAPNGQSATYYQAEAVTNGIFDGLSAFNYDDGTHGMYDVNWPDVITPVNGSTSCLLYSGLSNQVAGIQYDGIIAGGNSNAKIVHLGFPLETVYPSSYRDSLFCRMLNFFSDNSVVISPPAVNGATDICIGETIQLSATAQNGTISWYSDAALNQLVQTGNNLSLTPTSGSYTYYATETYNGSESTASIITFTVHPEPNLQTTPDTLICTPTLLTLDVSGANSYIWSTGATSSSINVYPEGDTTFIISGIDLNNCSTSDTIYVTTTPAPQSSFEASDTIVELNSATITFSNISINSTNYYWEFGDGTTSTDQSPWHQYTAAGFYSVQLLSFNNSCPADTLLKENYIEVINSTGIEELSSSFSILYFPNEKLTQIKSSSSTPYQLKITNMSGAVINFYQLTDTFELIDVSDLASGIYLFTITHKNLTKTFKISID